MRLLSSYIDVLILGSLPQEQELCFGLPGTKQATKAAWSSGKFADSALASCSLLMNACVAFKAAAWICHENPACKIGCFVKFM